MQSELGTVTDHLLSDYIPDDVPLGNQLTPNKVNHGAEKNKSGGEVIT